MQTENEYIGDDKFIKFLAHYECPSPIDVVKMRFAGAICSPNMALRPADVIASFWENNETPRLETKKEAELFFKFFMGLWDDIFNQIKQNKFALPELLKSEKADLRLWASARYDELEQGYLEGFWGGQQDLKIPAYLAQILDSLSEMADVYAALNKRVAKGDTSEEVRKTLAHTDKTVTRAIGFIVENAVLPRIESLKRQTN